ncbi:MAG: hypothetical protein VKO65_02065 [Cyanobacteriota bacterium]|nr:hypothetical protein [Cyanobacteriota bacterium]
MNERLPDRFTARGRSSSRARSTPDPLEQGLDRLVSAGRQLVDGVAGTRPGSRAGGRPGGRPRLAGLGRWVEEKLDWILEDEDDWREPWQQPERAVSRPVPPLEERGVPAAAPPPSPRRPLEAISRRAVSPAPGPAPAVAAPGASGSETGWPDEQTFSLSRWQRPDRQAERRPSAEAQPDPRARQLPRSSRRRQP